MTIVRLTERAEAQLEDIYEYSRTRWGDAQADRYTRGILEACGSVGVNRIVSRPIAAEYEAQGFAVKHERHFIYWRRRTDDDIDVVTILHERQAQEPRITGLFDPDRYITLTTDR